MLLRGHPLNREDAIYAEKHLNRSTDPESYGAVVKYSLNVKIAILDHVQGIIARFILRYRITNGDQMLRDEDLTVHV